MPQIQAAMLNFRASYFMNFSALGISRATKPANINQRVPACSLACLQQQWRLNNKSAKVRMQASDLIARIAVVMKTCGEEVLMSHLGVVLYEYLGEEYPEVLGSILGALKVIRQSLLSLVFCTGSLGWK